MMAEINLDYLNECFTWDYDGNLTWKERPRSHFTSDGDYKRFFTRFVNKPAGYIDRSGYYAVGLCRKTRAAHRILYMLYHNTIIPDGLEVDHEDENKLNNTFKNLRLATNGQNKCNISKRKDNTTGYKGVSFDKYRKKFESRIRFGGKKEFLGRFDTAEDAYEAYKAASVKYHGEFSNFG